MKKTAIYNPFLTDTAGAFGIKKRDWLLPLLWLFLLTGTGCQSPSDAADQQQEEQAVEIAIATEPENVAAGTASPDSLVVNGIHVPTGLVADEGYLLVRNNCSGCHSLDLVKNKRASREGWLATIRWMQQTQGLWDLGSNEKPILDYLAKNYAPQDAGRRRQLTNIEWYILEE